MKKYPSFLTTSIIVIVSFASYAGIVYAAAPITQVTNGGTATNTFTSGLVAAGGGTNKLYGGNATTTATCSGSVSCSSFVVLGASPIAISGSGGTNFWTSLGGNIYNNTGARVQFPAFDATSTTATSTITNALTVAKYLNVGAAPGYGYFPEDFVDVWNASTANDLTAVNVGSAGTGPCAQSLYAANGDNLTLNQDFTTLSNTNTGYTGGACAIQSPTNVNPESTYLYQPTWDINFVLGTTTNSVAGVPTGFKWLTASGATQAMVLTNQGNLGIGTSSPFIQGLTVTNGLSDVTDAITYDIDLGDPTHNNASAIQFEDSPSFTPTKYQTLASAGGNFNFYAATSTPNNLTNTELIGSLGVGSTFFTAKGFTAFSIYPSITQAGPSLQINNNVANSATGLGITTAATGGTTALNALDTGTNSSISLNGKGTGSVAIVSATTNITATNTQIGGTVSGGSKFTITTASTQFNQAGNGASANTTYLFTGVANVNLTATGEKKQFYINVGQSQSHASGAIVTQRDVEITPTTQTFTAGTTVANSTIGSTTSVSIDGPPTQGPISNFTQVQAVYIGRGGVYTASTTNAAGIYVDAPIGATNNEAAVFNGNTGIGTTTPTTAFVSVAASTTVGTVQDSYKGMVAIIGGLENGVTKLFFSIDQWGHEITSGDAPTVTGGTSSVAGNDNNGIITVTGTALTSVTLTFAHPWATAPDCTESDNSTALTADITSISTTQVVFGFSIGVNSGTVWYQCVGHQ